MRPAPHAHTPQHDPAPRRDPAPGHGRPPRTSVHDRVALDEIELYAELIIAAQRSDEPLSHEAIDAILGVRPPATVGA